MSDNAAISGNTANGINNFGGGGVLIYSGAFTMSGGTITGNTAEILVGGGVEIWQGSFTMSGGTISENTITNPYKNFFINPSGAANPQPVTSANIFVNGQNPATYGDNSRIFPATPYYSWNAPGNGYSVDSFDGYGTDQTVTGHN
jgi:hypothetical protein